MSLVLSEAQRAEYESFANLLRTFRAEHTQDLTAHLENPTHSTTWPLHPSEVTVPQWGLHDEVAAFARSLVGDDEYDPDPLPLLVEDMLSRLLLHIASQLSQEADGLAPREHPIGWETILNTLAASSSSHIAQRVRERLKDIYLPKPVPFLDDPALVPPKQFVATRFPAQPATPFLSVPLSLTHAQLRAKLSRIRAALTDDLTPEEHTPSPSRRRRPRQSPRLQTPHSPSTGEEHDPPPRASKRRKTSHSPAPSLPSSQASPQSIPAAGSSNSRVSTPISPPHFSSSTKQKGKKRAHSQTGLKESHDASHAESDELDLEDAQNSQNDQEMEDDQPDEHPEEHTVTNDHMSDDQPSQTPTSSPPLSPAPASSSQLHPSSPPPPTRPRSQSRSSSVRPPRLKRKNLKKKA